MSSLVIELQREAMNPATRVTDLLRKALVVATKLQQFELREWAQRELKGYADGTSCPDYRRVQGVVQAHNPYHGWQTVMFADARTASVLSQRYAGQSIGELEDLSTRGKGQLQMPFPHDQLMRVFGNSEAFQLGMIPTLIIDKAHLTGILDSVQNLVLEWSLRLEQDGIMGEGFTFSREEVSKANGVTYNIQSFNGIIGNVTGNIAHVGDFNSIRDELKSRGISDTESKELESLLMPVPPADKEARRSLAMRGAAWLAKNGSAIGSLSDTIRGWFEALNS